MSPPPASSDPTISVLLPFWNCRATLRPAVTSILEQTWSDFELILLDDGSTDGSSELAAALRDPRIRLISPGGHSGYVKLLNQGIAQSRGEFIARMDADDISHPERFTRQVALLRENPTIGICGTWARRFKEDQTIGWTRPPTTPAAVASGAFFECPFVHPTVLTRRAILEKTGLRYDPQKTPAEDYDLWVRLLSITTGANLAHVLLDYRLSEKQISQVMTPEKRRVQEEIWRRQVQRLGLEPSAAGWSLHFNLLRGAWECTDSFAHAAVEWLVQLAKANQHHRAFPEETFTAMLAERAFHVSCVCSRSHFAAWRLFRRSKLSSRLPQARARLIKLAIRCLLPPRNSVSRS